jgi:Flp pilus assembly pilin Flp
VGSPIRGIPRSAAANDDESELLEISIEAYAARLLPFEGGDCDMTSFSTDLLASIRAKLQVDVGQTMAEYAVVLGVITILVVGALTALSTGIRGSITNVVGFL